MFFNLSLHRSATTSVARLFRDFNHQCCDWVGRNFERKNNHLFSRSTSDELLDALLTRFPNCSYYGDLPIPLLYKQLLTRYPDANYFAVLRDIDDWAISSVEHCLYVGKHPSNPTKDILTPSNRMMLDQYNLLEEVRPHLNNEANRTRLLKIWADLYQMHLTSITEFFAQKKKHLQIFHLSDSDLAAQLLKYACPDLPETDRSSYKLVHLHSNDRGRDKLQPTA
jgi:hypothetical protein